MEIQVNGLSIPVLINDWKDVTIDDYHRVVAYYPAYLWRKHSWKSGAGWPILPYMLSASQDMADQSGTKDWMFDRYKGGLKMPTFERVIGAALQLWQSRNYGDVIRQALVGIGRCDEKEMEVPLFTKDMDCPYCECGAITGRRDMNTMLFLNWDLCLLCGQKIIFKSIGEHQALNDYINQKQGG